jgi:hypothetical protein
METTNETTCASAKETEVGSTNKNIAPAVAPADAESNAERVNAQVQEEREIRKRKTKKAQPRGLPRRW